MTITATGIDCDSTSCSPGFCVCPYSTASSRNTSAGGGRDQLAPAPADVDELLEVLHRCMWWEQPAQDSYEPPRGGAEVFPDPASLRRQLEDGD